MESSYTDTRSTDGSDTEGSLKDFVVLSGGDEEVALPDDDDDTLEWPYREAPPGTRVTDSSGRRISLRTRREPDRYVDENMAGLLLNDVPHTELDAALGDTSDEPSGEPETDDYCESNGSDAVDDDDE